MNPGLFPLNPFLLLIIALISIQHCISGASGAAFQQPLLPMSAVPHDVLVLGVGWTGNYLIKACASAGLNCIGTTRDGRDGTVKFAFGRDRPGELPDARLIVVTFPLLGAKQVDELYGEYIEGVKASFDRKETKWILLGSSRAFEGLGATRDDKFLNRSVLPDRTEAEDESIKKYGGTVLNLAGLWGGERQPRRFLQSVFGPNGERVISAFSLHLIHGTDIARLILKIREKMLSKEGLEPGRWLVTDREVYDEWQLGLWEGWTNEATQEAIRKTMKEQGIPELPRPKDQLKRWLDTSELWERFGIKPKVHLDKNSGAPGSTL